MKKGYNILLDEFMNPSNVFKLTDNLVYLDKKFEVVRSYNDFVDLIAYRYMNGEFPDIISFGYELVNDFIPNDDIEVAIYKKNGCDALAWYYKFCEQQDSTPAKILIHTNNEIGKNSMLSIIETKNDRNNKGI